VRQRLESTRNDKYQPDCAMTDLNSGVPDNEAYAGQILDGAKMIARYLVHLGFSDMNEKKVFQWAADGRLPVKKIGNRLVASKRMLLRHFGLD
jgi:hypothetical protein